MHEPRSSAAENGTSVSGSTTIGAAVATIRALRLQADVKPDVRGRKRGHGHGFRKPGAYAADASRTRRAGVLPACLSSASSRPRKTTRAVQVEIREAFPLIHAEQPDREVELPHVGADQDPVSSFARRTPTEIAGQLLPAAPVAPEYFRFSSVGKVAAAIRVSYSEQTSPAS